jgi:hypothetical protein
VWVGVVTVVHDRDGGSAATVSDSDSAGEALF